MTEEIVLDIKNLNVEYKTKGTVFNETRTVNAINNLSLEVKKGEILAIAGESGCGKSTLASAITRLIPIKSGDVFFHGINIFKLNQKQMKIYRQSLQMVFQNPYSSLNPKMKINEIMQEPLKINSELCTYSEDGRPLYEFSQLEIKKILLQVLDTVGLDADVLDRYPHEFSGGQRQRIAIARAMAHKPSILFADEPTGALDTTTGIYIAELFKKMTRTENLTVIMTTHDIRLSELADVLIQL